MITLRLNLCPSMHLQQTLRRRLQRSLGQAILNKLPMKDFITLIENWIAKVGKSIVNSTLGTVLVLVQEMKERLEAFLHDEQSYIQGDKEIVDMDEPPGDGVRDNIDYILMVICRIRKSSSLQDVKIVIGEDRGIGSDQQIRDRIT